MSKESCLDFELSKEKFNKKIGLKSSFNPPKKLVPVESQIRDVASSNSNANKNSPQEAPKKNLTLRDFLITPEKNTNENNNNHNNNNNNTSNSKYPAWTQPKSDSNKVLTNLPSGPPNLSLAQISSIKISPNKTNAANTIISPSPSKGKKLFERVFEENKNMAIEIIDSPIKKNINNHNNHSINLTNSNRAPITIAQWTSTKKISEDDKEKNKPSYASRYREYHNKRGAKPVKAQKNTTKKKKSLWDRSEDEDDEDDDDLDGFIAHSEESEESYGSSESSEGSESTQLSDSPIKPIVTRNTRNTNKKQSLSIQKKGKNQTTLEIDLIEDDWIDGLEEIDKAPISKIPQSNHSRTLSNKRKMALIDSDDEEDEEKDSSNHSQDQEDSSSSEQNNKKYPKKQKGSKLQELLDMCEAKVDNLTQLLSSTGLDYEKLKNTETSLELTLTEKQPPSLARECQLTNYQLVGLNWLYLLYMGNSNGILADEMGLGKTLQTIALLTLLKEKGIKGPHLIVVPSSTLTQWGNEIQKWSPGLSYVTYYGSLAEREDMRREWKKNQNFNVLLTTYQLVGGKYDKKLFKKIAWQYLILDEAQNIKNGKSLRFQSLFKLKAKRRLLLTGTPLQNNLEELWALLHFLMPSEFSQIQLGSYSEVFRDYLKQNKVEKKRKISAQDEYIQKLKKIIEPFLLRRLKEQVSLGLQPKVHLKQICSMTETQQKLYDQIYTHSKSLWKEKEMQRGNISVEGKSISLHNFLNNLLMQLRKVGNHPLLLRVYYDDEMIAKIAHILRKKDDQYKKDSLGDIISELSGASDWELHEICQYRRTSIPELQEFVLTNEQVYDISGKMNQLESILEKLKKEGHRVLIFSQMTKMMNILGCFFDDLGYKYLRLDGTTPVNDRQYLIDKYNKNDKYFIFLLSTRAGGLGINLSTADTVIFYDISFNPQVDRQAEDRCHRLGQKKEVKVITLITKNTCEEQIWEMAHEKKELNDIMLKEGEYNKKIDKNPHSNIDSYQSENEGTSIDLAIEEKEEEDIASDFALSNVLSHLFDDSNINQIASRTNENPGSNKVGHTSTNQSNLDAKEAKKKPITVSLFDDCLEDIYESRSSSESMSEKEKKNDREIRNYAIHIEDDEDERNRKDDKRESRVSVAPTKRESHHNPSINKKSFSIDLT